MSTANHFTFSDAYKDGLRALLRDGQSVASVIDPLSAASNFGKGDRPALELLGHGFVIPANELPLIVTQHRLLNLPYLVGLLFWSLRASNRLNEIAYYDANAKRFSNDGAHLCGAFGHRLKSSSTSFESQFDSIINRLLQDPSSRRAIGLVCTHNDVHGNSFEFPCALAVQYFRRNEELHAVTFMRAQHALTILPYDVFLFVAFQQYIASRLGVTSGSYTHFAGTFHIYDDERDLAERIIFDSVESVSFGQLPSRNDLDVLLELEMELRQIGFGGGQKNIDGIVENVRLKDNFSLNAIHILAAYAQSKCSNYDASRNYASKLQHTRLQAEMLRFLDRIQARDY